MPPRPDCRRPAMDLSRFPRRRYTQGATPIEPLRHLSRALGGPAIYVKRDDMLGLPKPSTHSGGTHCALAEPTSAAMSSTTAP